MLLLKLCGKGLTIYKNNANSLKNGLDDVNASVYFSVNGGTPILAGRGFPYDVYKYILSRRFSMLYIFLKEKIITL
jgi:hypothetical protein